MGPPSPYLQTLLEVARAKYSFVFEQEFCDSVTWRFNGRVSIFGLKNPILIFPCQDVSKKVIYAEIIDEPELIQWKRLLTPKIVGLRLGNHRYHKAKSEFINRKFDC